MTFIEFIQLVLRNKKWVIIFPVIVAISIFFLTKNMPQTFSSEMVIYTGIASGYNVDNDINGKIDYHAANSKFDNLINTITSKETRKEVSLHLLASLLHHPNDLNRLIVSFKAEQLQWLSSKEVKSELVGNNENETYQNLVKQISLGPKNDFHRLLYGKNENPFNLNTLFGIKATRLGFSDMVKVEYTSKEAFITKRTLDVLAEVFLHKYKGMRVGEVNNVVKYFQEETALALSRLQNAEMILKNFRTDNRLINYYEQTKYIADQKESFEQNESQLQMEISGSESALKKIESKLNSRVLVKLKSDQLVKARNELSEKYNSQSLSLVKGASVTAAQNENTELIKKDLKDKVQELYQLNNSVEGIPGKDLLDQWLELTVNGTENRSKLEILQRNKSEFEKVYDKFAPMGSDLNKLERDVDVSEKEYLNLLHNLNQAKLREKNLVVTENISITDPPEMPSVANSSKRFILIIASFLSCIVMVLVVLILKEYMDDSISNPMRLLKSTGIKTATAFALSSAEFKKNEEQIEAISYERLMLSLLDNENKNVEGFSKILAVPFHKSDSNYQEILRNLVNEINRNGNNWGLNEMKEPKLQNSIFLAASPNREIINKDFLKDCTLIYLFINATQSMDEYHLEMLKGWQQTGIPVQAIMMDTKLHHLEKFLGEIPKQRSRIRKRIKDILKRYSK